MLNIFQKLKIFENNRIINILTLNYQRLLEIYYWYVLLIKFFIRYQIL
jgi:hypothetical protein